MTTVIIPFTFLYQTNVFNRQKEIVIEAGQELRGDVDETLTVEVSDDFTIQNIYSVYICIVTFG